MKTHGAQEPAAPKAPSQAFYDKADRLDYTLAPVDEAGDPQGKISYTYDKVGYLLITTEPKGNLTTTVGGLHHHQRLRQIYQLTNGTNAMGEKTTYEYDNVGHVQKVNRPAEEHDRGGGLADHLSFPAKTLARRGRSRGCG